MSIGYAEDEKSCLTCSLDRRGTYREQTLQHLISDCYDVRHILSKLLPAMEILIPSITGSSFLWFFGLSLVLIIHTIK